MHRTLFVSALSVALLLATPVAALAAGGEKHRSSNWPWVVGIIVVLLIIGGAAAMRLRRR